jgi:hypothetical protein
VTGLSSIRHPTVADWHEACRLLWFTIGPTTGSVGRSAGLLGCASLFSVGGSGLSGAADAQKAPRAADAQNAPRAPYADDTPNTQEGEYADGTAYTGDTSVGSARPARRETASVGIKPVNIRFLHVMHLTPAQQVLPRLKIAQEPALFHARPTAQTVPGLIKAGLDARPTPVR